MLAASPDCAAVQLSVTGVSELVYSDVQISTSRSGPYGTAAAKNGPTGSAYITYKNIVDARRCIETVHGETWEGEQSSAQS